MAKANLRSLLLVGLMLVISFAAAWLPVSLVRAGWPLQDGLIANEVPQEPPAGELRAGPYSTYDQPHLAGPDDPVEIMVELEDPPAIAAFVQAQEGAASFVGEAASQAVAASQARIARIEQAQQRLASVLTGPRFKAKITGSVQRVYNGIAMQVASGRLAEIEALPGVKAVHLPELFYPATDTSVPFIGAHRVWDPSLGGGGFRGEGIRIAVIDSGIDYTHANLGGSGLTTVFNSNNPTIIGDIADFPNAKVIGGVDLVGDSYNAADPANSTPNPDPDPIDCRSNGHGTGTAGIAAGIGINNNGTVYSGSYSLTTNFASLRIGPGVAPKANLYAIRVFGCNAFSAASNAVVVQAIDRAMDPNQDGNFSDRARVVLLPGGVPFGTLPNSPVIAAINNGALANVLYVGAAGNGGDTFLSVGGPAIAAGALAVVANADNGLFHQNLLVSSPGNIAGRFPSAVAEIGVPLSATLEKLLIYGVPADGCAPLTNGFQLNGNIAYLDRGTCTLTTKARNAQAAGAVALIIGNNTATLPVSVGDDGTGSDVIIPSFLLAQDGANAIRQELNGGQVVNVSLTPGDVTSQAGLANSYASFNPYGGVYGGNVLKPDIAAPGANIGGAAVGTGNNYKYFSGTSMSAPHVAGAAALLAQKYPDYTSRRIYDIVRSTGTGVFSGANSAPPQRGPSLVGGGGVNAEAAIRTFASVHTTQAITADGLYGEVIEATNDSTLALKLLFDWFNSTQTTTYNTTLINLANIPGATPQILNPTGTAAPNSTSSIEYGYLINRAALRRTCAPWVSPTQAGNARHCLPEMQSNVIFNLDPLFRPVFAPINAVVRPASTMGTTQTVLNLANPTGTFPITLTGQGVNNGPTLPGDWRSFVSPFELQWIDPNDALTPPELDHFDLQYVGVRKVGDRLLFGISAHGDWRSPNEVRFNVFIDNNRDGRDDFHLFTTSLPNAQGAPSDVQITSLFNINTQTPSSQVFFTNSFSPATLDSALYHTNVISLPITESLLGGPLSRFNYTVKTSFGNVVVDESGQLTWDPANQGLEFGTTTMFNDLPGGTIPVSYHVNSFRAANSEGALLLHHLNTQGNRAQILPALPVCPMVSNLNPASGAVGASVTITGANLNGVTGVRFANNVAAQFIVNSDTSITATVPAGATTGPLTISKSDCPDVQTAGFTVTQPCPPITVNPATIPPGTVGMPYSQTFTATGGTAPFTFSISAGALPVGLSLLASTGVLSGTPTASGIFNFTVRATDTNGCFGERAYMLTINQTNLQYYPLPSPVRLLDTRPGATGACVTPGAPLGANTASTQPAGGSCNIPSTAKAIYGNATVVTASTGGNLTLFQSNVTQPNVSNQTYAANQTISNEFTVGLGPDGAFKIFTSATTHFIVDITGYYAPPGTGGLYFHPLPAPVRLLDTRPGESACVTPGAPLGNGATRTQTATGSCGGVTIPSTAKAITGNATVVNFTSSGFHWITLYPFGTAQPEMQSLPFTDNQIVSNTFTVGLSNDGKFNIFSRAPTHLIVDLTGYFTEEPLDMNGAGLLYNPLPAPVRLLDTRAGQTACDTPGAPLTQDATRTQTATGTCAGVTIPVTAKAVGGIGTVVNFISSGFHWITLYPFGAAQPNTQSLSFTANQTVPNAFVTGLSRDGKFSIYSRAATHLILDLTGYFTPQGSVPDLEGDVAVRPNGDGSITIADWTQAGRFVAGLDPANPGSEYQRADTAPRANAGGGGLTVADWVQAGRYAAGLDTVQPAGGPVTPITGQSQIAGFLQGARYAIALGLSQISGVTLKTLSQSQQTRTLRAVSSGFLSGQTSALDLVLDALGGENAAGFTINFDPAVISFVSADLGGGAQGATLFVNTSQSAQGRVGIALALPAGQALQAGARSVASVRFNVIAGVSAINTQISFGDLLIKREIANVTADGVQTTYTGATVLILRATASVSAASFTGAEIATQSIVAAFGVMMATSTEVAASQPLPLALAGTTVRVKDSAGTERLAPLFFVAPGQINYQIPPGTANGPAMITVTSGNGATSVGNVNITTVAPGIFAANANGQGAAAALVLRRRANGSDVFEQVAVFDSALGRFVPLPIDLGPESDQVFLVLFGTGLRFRSALAAVTCGVGGANQEVLFAGETPGFVGLDQVNARLARSLIGRGEVDAAVTVDAKAANIVRINIK